MTTLEPMEPERAVELYLAEKQNGYAKSTVQSHRSRLRKFLDWSAEEGIDDLNDLTGRRLHEYRIWRRNEGDLAPASEKTRTDTLRVFVRWCESVDTSETSIPYTRFPTSDRRVDFPNTRRFLTEGPSSISKPPTILNQHRCHRPLTLSPLRVTQTV